MSEGVGGVDNNLGVIGGISGGKDSWGAKIRYAGELPEKYWVSERDWAIVEAVQEVGLLFGYNWIGKKSFISLLAGPVHITGTFHSQPLPATTNSSDAHLTPDQLGIYEINSFAPSTEATIGLRIAGFMAIGATAFFTYHPKKNYGGISLNLSFGDFDITGSK